MLEQVVKSYWRKYKIFSAILCGLILVGAALTLLKVQIGIIEGWTVFLVTVLAGLAYLDGFIRKLFKQFKGKSDND